MNPKELIKLKEKEIEELETMLNTGKTLQGEPLNNGQAINYSAGLFSRKSELKALKQMNELWLKRIDEWAMNNKDLCLKGYVKDGEFKGQWKDTIQLTQLKDLECTK